MREMPPNVSQSMPTQSADHRDVGGRVARMSEPSEYELREWDNLHRHRARTATRTVRSVGDKVTAGAGVIGTGLSKAAQRYPSIAKAQKVTNHAARRAGQAVPTSVTTAAEHVIHNMDGTISERNSYGNDPADRPG